MQDASKTTDPKVANLLNFAKKEPTDADAKIKNLLNLSKTTTE